MLAGMLLRIVATTRDESPLFSDRPRPHTARLSFIRSLTPDTLLTSRSLFDASSFPKRRLTTLGIPPLANRALSFHPSLKPTTVP